uniref:Uncharacterized protein n=1 Tax=Glossina pallidipes TaxID=7398 RepID=A0A1A9ZBH6_GLOPL
MNYREKRKNINATCDNREIFPYFMLYGPSAPNRKITFGRLPRQLYTEQMGSVFSLSWPNKWLKYTKYTSMAKESLGYLSVPKIVNWAKMLTPRIGIKSERNLRLTVHMLETCSAQQHPFTVQKKAYLHEAEQWPAKLDKSQECLY